MLESAELGAYTTLAGRTIPSVKLSYITHGTLSPEKDNAILFPHYLGAAPEGVAMWIGEGRALDPAKYFIICPGQLGNGSSTSPSNTPSPLNAGAFPPVTFADDVILQKRLAEQVWGITEFQLLLGWSTGGLQIYEWAVRFPGMVKRLAAIACTPKPSPWTKLWLSTVLAEPLTSHPGFNAGFYTDKGALQDGQRRMGRGAALTLPPPGFYREGHETWKNLGITSAEDFVALVWEQYWLPQDPNDLLVQVRKALAADPAAGGDLAQALAKITAKTAVIAFTGDPMFPPLDGKRDAEAISGASFNEVPTQFGHLATFGFAESDRVAVDAILADLLAK